MTSHPTGEALHTEYEAKVLDIDPTEIAEKIVQCGGKQVSSTVTMRRYVYDLPPADQSRWVRLRDNGHQTTLAVKEITSDNIDGTKEYEVAVDDFEATNLVLSKLGFLPKSYQENRRTSFLLGDVQLEIDEWPMIPPYLEIEASSDQEVFDAARQLGYARSDLTSENTIKIYQRYGHNLGSIPRLQFHENAIMR